MRFIAGIFFLSSTIFSSFAQHQVSLTFVPTFAGSPIEFEKQYITAQGDSFLFENFRFYVSGFSFLQDEGHIFQSKAEPHLVDINDAASLSFKIPSPKIFYSLKFNLGVDSTTNVSGVLGGDLDPTKGMYWTWQSGYINLKLEGKSNLCPTRNNVFEFHLGGYNGKNNALQIVIIRSENNKEIIIEIPLDQFLSQLNLTKQNQVMIPGQEAVALSKMFAQIFRLKAE